MHIIICIYDSRYYANSIMNNGISNIQTTKVVGDFNSLFKPRRAKVNIVSIQLN